ncbi:MAG: hypothetical protein JNK74_02020 [Candidatus Hydrogenedentes bacterium]|nr:hypothetical protein [Candidatus Hydrogenedentota bacterium]
MTIPATEQKRPPATILYRATPFTVFKTLLWAEFAPRFSVLRVIVTLLVLLWLMEFPFWLTSDRMPEGDPSSALEVDLFSRLLALSGVLYCALHEGLRGMAARPAWQALVLPVRVHWLVFPGIAFQFGIALLLASLWGLHRYFGGIEAPFSQPFQWTTVLATQIQAVALWCAAAGAARGLPVFGLGLAVAYCAGTLATHIGPFSPATNQAAVLVISGWISTLLAARAIRGGTIPEMDPLRLPGVRRIHDWHLARAARKTRFTSPFWAQVWFEWRRTAWWFAAVVVAVATVKLLVDIPYILTWGESLFEQVQSENGDTTPAISGSIILVAILLFWFTHIALSGPYRRFVFSRPTSVGRVSWAKLLTVCLAAAVFLTVSAMSREIYSVMLPSTEAELPSAEGSGLWSVSIAAMSTAVFFFLLLVYGPFVIAGFTYLYIIVHLAFGDFGGTTDSNIEIIGTVIVAASALASGAVPFILTGILLKRRLDFRCYPVPWELLVALMIFPGLLAFAWYEQFSGASGPGKFLFVYVGPTILAIGMTQYGRRAGLFGVGPQLGLLAVFVLSFTVGMHSAEDYSLESLERIEMVTGYFIAVAISPFVIYPIAIGSQRLEPELGSHSALPNWVVFVLAPLVWLALQLLGEDLSKREGRQ